MSIPNANISGYCDSTFNLQTTIDTANIIRPSLPEHEHSYPTFTLPQMIPQRTPTDTASLQSLMDENAELLKSALEYQRLGRIVEAASYQSRLHSNLIVLANLADRLMKSKRFKTSGYSTCAPLNNPITGSFPIDSYRNNSQRQLAPRQIKDSNSICRPNSNDFKSIISPLISSKDDTNNNMNISQGENIIDIQSSDMPRITNFNILDGDIKDK